jgi:hypothetical protein
MIAILYQLNDIQICKTGSDLRRRTSLLLEVLLAIFGSKLKIL